MGKRRSGRRRIVGWLAVLAASLPPLVQGLSMIATSGTDSRVLRELGNAAMRTVPSANNLPEGRRIALIGKVDPTAPEVQNLAFVLGMTERLRVQTLGPSHGPYSAEWGAVRS